MLTPIDILHIHNFVIGSASFGLNCAVIYALLAHYEPEWHQLRIFLALNAFMDASFSIVEMANQFTVYVSNGALLFFSTGPIHYLGREASIVCMLLYCNLIYVTFMAIPSTFVYRLPIFQPSIFPSPAKCTVLILVTIVIFSIPTAITVVGIVPNEQEATMLLRYFMVSDELRSTPFIGGHMTQWHFWAFLLAVGAEFMLSYTVVAIFVVKLTRLLKEHMDSLSPETKKMHQRLTYALLLEASFPLLTSAMPVFVNIVMTCIGASPGPTIPILINAAFSWMPLMNAVTALTFFKPYRMFLLRKLRIFRERATSTVSNTNNTNA